MKNGRVSKIYCRGEKRMELHLKNHLLHREDGPAQIKFSGRHPVYEAWFKDGLRHNDIGPAIKQYDEQGNVICAENWLNGNFYGRSYFKRRA
ncbi:hypothetical protein [Desulfospira joergensenii]|uniref:hypothetical protein n=1 Tax=Desulfospira joergensenii TaxID=53329 RepID=UPI0003B590C7|nr:hypothetical protein [Desulfospira joergensenii]